MSGPWMWWFSGALLGLAGVLIAFVALFTDRSRGRLRCPRCWYDMMGSATLACPECGREARSPAALRRTRRRWRRAGAVPVLILAGLLVGAYPACRAGGWTRFTPTTALVLLTPWATAWDNATADVYFEEIDTRSMGRWQYRMFAARVLAAAKDVPLGQGSRLSALLLKVLRYRDGECFISLAQLIKSRPDWSEWDLAFGLAECGLEPQRTVADLVVLFDRADQTVQFITTVALAEFGPAAAPAVPRLIEALEAQPRYPHHIVSALARIGEPAVEPLIGLVRGRITGPRVNAVEALGQMKDLTPEARDALFEFVTDRDAQVRFAAAIGLANHGQNLPGVVDTLSMGLEQAAGVDHRAVRALENLGPAAEAALPALRRCLDAATRGRDRCSIAYAMATIQPGGREPLAAIYEFGALLEAEPRTYRHWLPGAMERLGIESADCRAQLVDLLRDEDEGVWRRAHDALVRLGSLAVQHLAAAARDGPPLQRFRAVSILAGMPEPSDIAVAGDLRRVRDLAVQDTDASVRVAGAWWSLNRYGLAVNADEMFKVAASSAPSDARQLARTVLLRCLSQAELLPFLEARLHDAQPSHRRAAADLLAERTYDPAARQALLDAMNHPDPAVRVAAASALALDLDRPPEAIPALISLLSDPDPAVRSDAALALRFCREEAREALPALRAGAADPDPVAAAAMAAAIEDIDPYRPEADIPMLVASLADDDAPTRRTAAEVLGELGPLAAAAVPHLEALQDDEDDQVRAAAAAAIAAILSPPPPKDDGM